MFICKNCSKKFFLKDVSCNPKCPLRDKCHIMKCPNCGAININKLKFFINKIKKFFYNKYNKIII